MKIQYQQEDEELRMKDAKLVEKILKDTDISKSSEYNYGTPEGKIDNSKYSQLEPLTHVL